jgi:hypothetical protein
MKISKERVFTFKTDEKLAELLDHMPNRSEFIRKALLTAMDRHCPLCHGSGILTQEQQNHLEQFLATHPLEKCACCNAFHFTCRQQSPRPPITADFI